MKTQFLRKTFGLIIVMIMAYPALAGSQEGRKAADETSQQRQQCDAGCRENYQNNAAALEACLRDCGAIGPAQPAGIAVTPDATPPATEATTVKSSKSNSQDRMSTVKSSKSNTSERQAAAPVEPPVPAATSNLNLSKSNINRDSGKPSDAPAKAINLNPGKSNVDQAAGGTSGTPVEGVTSESEAAKASTYTNQEGDTVTTVDDQR